MNSPRARLRGIVGSTVRQETRVDGACGLRTVGFAFRASRPPGLWWLPAADAEGDLRLRSRLGHRSANWALPPARDALRWCSFSGRSKET